MSEIRCMHTLNPSLGKAKLHGLLEPSCSQHDLALPCIATIGRTITPEMRHAPSRIDHLGRSKHLRQHLKPRKPKQVSANTLESLAWDTFERIRDGMRR